MLGTSSAELAPFLAKIPEGGDSEGKVKIVDDSPTKEVVDGLDLRELPILTHFRGDDGAYITGGVVVAELDGVRNASIHRLMILDKKRLAARLVPPRHLYKMHREAMERGEELKVGIAIGVDPLVLLAASTRVPPRKEFEYASALKNLSFSEAFSVNAFLKGLKKALPNNYYSSSILSRDKGAEADKTFDGLLPGEEEGIGKYSLV